MIVTILVFSSAASTALARWAPPAGHKNPIVNYKEPIVMPPPPAYDRKTARDSVQPVDRFGAQQAESPSSPVIAAEVSDTDAWTALNEALFSFTIKRPTVIHTPAEVQAYTMFAKMPLVNTMCETGFDSGYSSMLLLLANRKARLYSFDLDLENEPYTKVARSVLENVFGSRFVYIQGNSTHTLNAFAKEFPKVKCDLVVADGERDAKRFVSDLESLARMSNAAHNSLLVPGTPCAAAWCAGRTEGWQAAKREGIIMQGLAQALDFNHGISEGFLVPAVAVNKLASKAGSLLSSRARRVSA